jgi:hypothetical protein
MAIQLATPARKPKTVARLTKPVQYKAYILAPQKDGSVDLIDPDSGRWVRSSTPRYAKWRATFLSNINEEFQRSAPVKVPQVQS